MERFILRPSLDLYEGVRVTKDTELSFESETVKQTVKDLVLHSVVTLRGEDYETVHDARVFLREGDVLIRDEHRGYFKPTEGICTVSDAIKDLEVLREIACAHRSVSS